MKIIVELCCNNCACAILLLEMSVTGILRRQWYIRNAFTNIKRFYSNGEGMPLTFASPTQVIIILFYLMLILLGLLS